MITWLIIGVTVAVSYFGFRNSDMMEKLQFNAAAIFHEKQYYRLFTHAFIHANWTHLFVNMFVLFFFGRALENYFGYLFGNGKTVYYLLLYAGGILASNVYSLYRHKNNYYYNAVGASGAVSAVLFAFIFLNPLEKIYFYVLIPVPGIIFAIGYLFYSWYMSRRESDHVAHDAHFLGAVFGFIYPALLKPALLGHFLDQLRGLI